MKKEQSTGTSPRSIFSYVWHPWHPPKPGPHFGPTTIPVPTTGAAQRPTTTTGRSCPKSPWPRAMELWVFKSCSEPWDAQAWTTVSSVDGLSSNTFGRVHLRREWSRCRGVLSCVVFFVLQSDCCLFGDGKRLPRSKGLRRFGRDPLRICRVTVCREFGRDTGSDCSVARIKHRRL